MVLPRIQNRGELITHLFAWILINYISIIQRNMNEEDTGKEFENNEVAECRYNGDDTLPPTDVYVHGAIRELGGVALDDEDDNYDRCAQTHTESSAQILKNKRVIPRLQLRGGGGIAAAPVPSNVAAGIGYETEIQGNVEGSGKVEDSYELPGQIKSPTHRSEQMLSAQSSGSKEQFSWDRVGRGNHELLYQMQDREPATPNDGYYTATTNSERNQLISGQKSVGKDSEEDAEFEELVYQQGINHHKNRDSLIKMGHVYGEIDDDEEAAHCHGIARSKTGEYWPHSKARHADGPDHLIALSDLSKADQYGGKYYTRRAINYKEQEYLSEAKVLATTLQTEGNLMHGSDHNQYTQREAFATERQLQKKTSGNSSMFGSIELPTPLRSARNLNPKTFNDLRGNPAQQKLSPQQAGAVTLPRINCRQLVKRAVQGYFSSCIDGIFLRYLFCKAVSLKWYLFFMIATDTLLALIDASTMHNRIVVLQDTTWEPRFQIGLLLALIFFAIKLVLYVPTIVLSFILLRLNKLQQGKWLYGIKLATFFVIFLFNFIAIFFIPPDGCNIFHATINHKSFESPSNYEVKWARGGPVTDGATFNTSIVRPQDNNEKSKLQCHQGWQIAEIIGLFIYHFFTCWVILSTLHWIRRGHSGEDPSSSFLNLVPQSRYPNAIVTNHLRGKPLVHSQQLQKKQNYRLGTQIYTPIEQTTMKTLAADEEMDFGIEEDDVVHLTSKQKDIHVNLKVAMKTLSDFRLDSQRTRLKKSSTVKPTAINLSKGKRAAQKSVPTKSKK